MSDRALLEELLEFIDNIVGYDSYLDMYKEIVKKAKEIRTRMSVERSCQNCGYFHADNNCEYCIEQTIQTLPHWKYKEEKDGN